MADDFKTGAELEVTVSQSSLRDARRKIESELGDITVEVAAEVSGGGGMQPRDPETGRFMAIEGVEQRIIEQTDVLMQMGGTDNREQRRRRREFQWSRRQLTLSEERNEILLAINEDIEDLEGEFGGGGGRLLRGLGGGAALFGGGLLGAGILGASLISFLDDFEFESPDWLPPEFTQPDWLPPTLPKPGWIPIGVEEPSPVPYGGPNPIPTEDPDEVPYGGPNPVPVEDPGTAPYEGPNPVPVEDPGTVPYDGPNPVPVEEPSPVPYGGPNPVPVEDPGTVPYSGPDPIPVDAPTSIPVEFPELSLDITPEQILGGVAVGGGIAAWLASRSGAGAAGASGLGFPAPSILFGREAQRASEQPPEERNAFEDIMARFSPERIFEGIDTNRSASAGMATASLNAPVDSTFTFSPTIDMSGIDLSGLSDEVANSILNSRQFEREVQNLSDDVVDNLVRQINRQTGLNISP